MKEWNQALKSINEALEINGSSALAFDLKGLILMQQGSYEESLSAFNQAIFFKIKVYQVSGTQLEDELNSVMLHLPSWNASKLAFFCIPRL